MDTTPRHGDSDNILLKKIAQSSHDAGSSTVLPIFNNDGGIVMQSSVSATEVFDGAGNPVIRLQDGVQSGPVFDVSELPPAVAHLGGRAIVDDALNPVFGSPVAGLGAVTIPVYSDGVVWRVG